MHTLSVPLQLIIKHYRCRINILERNLTQMFNRNQLQFVPFPLGSPLPVQKLPTTKALFKRWAWTSGLLCLEGGWRNQMGPGVNSPVLSIETCFLLSIWTREEEWVSSAQFKLGLHNNIIQPRTCTNILHTSLVSTRNVGENLFQRQKYSTVQHESIYF